MTGNTIGSGGHVPHINTPPSDTTPGRAQTAPTATSRARAGSDPLASERVSTGPGSTRRNSLPSLQMLHSGRAPSSGAALGHPQHTTLRDEASPADPGGPGRPDLWTKGFDAVVRETAELPKNAASRETAAKASQWLLTASSRAIQWTLHCSPEQSELRDQIQLHATFVLKNMAATLREHGVVHDETRMNALVDGFLGKNGTVYSAQTAFSELPQHALDLPSPQRDAQTVRLLTKLAEMAVETAGLEALQSDPSWASYLVDHRINVVLDRKGIDVQGHPALRDAVEALLKTGDRLVEP